MLALNMGWARRKFIKSGIVAAGALAASGVNPGAAQAEGSLFPQHEPLGTGKGIHPGRVVWIHEPKGGNWSGVDYRWKPENMIPIC